MTEPDIPPPPPPPPPPARTCDECGAALDERQEICVECGHAAGPPERRRLRGVLPTASVAAFAVLLAASAAYGLSAGGASNVRDLGVGQSKPPGTDTVAQATPTPPPATTSPTPDTVPQATPTPPPASSTPTPAPKAPKPAAKAKTPAATTPSTPSSPSGTTPSNPTTKPHHHHHSTKPPRHHTTGPPSWFADADQPYDAFNYGGGSKPSRAIDGKPKTAWTTTSKGTGLIVDTGQYQPYNGIGIATSTPGFSVSVYSGDNNTGSGDPSSNGWKREARASSVGKYQRVVWTGSNKTPHYLLIWITKLPSGSAALNEIRLLLY